MVLVSLGWIMESSSLYGCLNMKQLPMVVLERCKGWNCHYHGIVFQFSLFPNSYILLSCTAAEGDPSSAGGFHGEPAGKKLLRITSNGEGVQYFSYLLHCTLVYV